MKTTLFCKDNTLTFVLLICALTATKSVAASPTVNGNVISWTDEGWHQVQNQATFESLCEGGRQCVVPPGVYIVINHGTGDRFRDITVVAQGGDSAPAPVAATGQIVSYGVGDDGDYQSGVSVSGERFKDNGDGTFTDNLTGLVWLGIRDCFVQRDWIGALELANSIAANSDACPTLNDDSEAGDWRLPNVKELFSLVNITVDTALIQGIPLNGDWNLPPNQFSI